MSLRRRIAAAVAVAVVVTGAAALSACGYAHQVKTGTIDPLTNDLKGLTVTRVGVTVDPHCLPDSRHAGNSKITITVVVKNEQNPPGVGISAYIKVSGTKKGQATVDPQQEVVFTVTIHEAHRNIEVIPRGIHGDYVPIFQRYFNDPVPCGVPSGVNKDAKPYVLPKPSPHPSPRPSRSPPHRG